MKDKVPETSIREELDLSAEAPTERLDVRELGPPGPLKETLETLADLDEEVVLIQLNDREPKHLYPKLEDRGYEYRTVEHNDTTVTAIWSP